jgi:hypothetical protein
VNSEHSISAWQALLDADLNARYWRYMGLRYTRREGWAKIFLATTASATVASWSLWAEVKLLWQSFSVIAALVSVAMPIIDAPRKIAAMTEAQAAWLQLMHEYDDLWRSRASIGERAFASKLSSLREREVDVSKMTATLPSDDSVLAERCYAEVATSRGLAA